MSAICDVVTFFGPCPFPGVAIVSMGCVHEHIRVGPMCNGHEQEAQIPETADCKALLGRPRLAPMRPELHRSRADRGDGMTERIDQRVLWSRAAVGDVLPPHDDPPCFYPGPYGLECCRAEKHGTQHVATGGGVVLAVWQDVTAPSLDGRLRRLEVARLERAVRR